jgi:hypothetical protein
MGQSLKQIIICTESMIVFIINGIVINLQKCMKIGHFKYRLTPGDHRYICFSIILRQIDKKEQNISPFL